MPKAVAAERHLRKVNSAIEIEGIVADVNFTNIEKLVRGADIILDGLDNLETRFLINDAALKLKIPWVYGGAISSFGMTMNIIPDKTPCLRCIHGNASGGLVFNLRYRRCRRAGSFYHCFPAKRGGDENTDR